MITGEPRRQADALWAELRRGGITDSLTRIEQITFLIYARLLDINEKRGESREKRTGKPFARRFTEKEKDLRWSRFRKLSAEEMLPLVRDRVFPHFKSAGADEDAFGALSKGAQLEIQDPGLLARVVSMIHALPLKEEGVKGDLYEYLLSKLSVAGSQSQFRTPRHIIRLMVELLAPKPTDVIGDPACGTGGFLTSVVDYLREQHTSPEAIIEDADPASGEIRKRYTGDLLKRHRKHIRNEMFHGFDRDHSMSRIAAMNLMLHGIDHPDIHCQNTLSTKFAESFKQMRECFNVILANPPFRRKLDFAETNPHLLSQVKTKETELLFPLLILQMLKPGGCAATIVPERVLSSTSMYYLRLRKLLLDNNKLEGVITLPAGVFWPYAGIATGILVFAKDGTTKDVFFYNIRADGYSRGDRRNKTERNDLPDCLRRWRHRDVKKDQDRTAPYFFVPADEIRDANYNLSFARHREIVYREADYDPPQTILKRMGLLNQEIDSDLSDIEELLR